MRVLIVDDHAAVRQALRQILAESGSVARIGEAEDGADAIRQLRAGGWSVVLLDVSLPDCSGIEILEQIGREFPGTSVLMISMHEEDPYATRALRAGASGYLAKRRASAELMAALREVRSGRRYLAPAPERDHVRKTRQID